MTFGILSPGLANHAYRRLRDKFFIDAFFSYYGSLFRAILFPIFNSSDLLFIELKFLDLLSSLAEFFNSVGVLLLQTVPT